MADARAILSTIGCIIWWPTGKILSAIRSILAPFWALLQFILLPIAYLIHAILHIVLFPFRLDLLERIETIYVWIGLAALVGCATGATLFLLYKFLTSAFNIDAASQTRVHAKGRTIKQYRSARREKGAMAESSSGPTVVNIAAPRRRVLVSQAIMEEESEF